MGQKAKPPVQSITSPWRVRSAQKGQQRSSSNPNIVGSKTPPDQSHACGKPQARAKRLEGTGIGRLTRDDTDGDIHVHNITSEGGGDHAGADQHPSGHHHEAVAEAIAEDRRQRSWMGGRGREPWSTPKSATSPATISFRGSSRTLAQVPVMCHLPCQLASCRRASP